MPAGLEPVLHPNSPPWLNQLIDALQFRSVKRAIAIATLPDGARILDVGCGTGRGLRRSEELGYHATGVEATLECFAWRANAELLRQSRHGKRIAYHFPMRNSILFRYHGDPTYSRFASAAGFSEMMRVIRYRRPAYPDGTYRRNG